MKFYKLEEMLAGTLESLINWAAIILNSIYIHVEVGLHCLIIINYLPIEIKPFA